MKVNLLPIFLNEVQDFKCKKIVILEETDFNTINSIKSFTDIKIHYQNIQKVMVQQ